MEAGRKHFLGGHIGKPRSHFLSRVMRRRENVGAVVSDPGLHPRDPPLLSEMVTINTGFPEMRGGWDGSQG